MIRATDVGPRAIVEFLSPKGRVTRRAYLLGFGLPSLALGIGMSGVLERRSLVGLVVFLALYAAAGIAFLVASSTSGEPRTNRYGRAPTT